jgi:Gpi18-like mannosyltransferase
VSLGFFNKVNPVYRNWFIGLSGVQILFMFWLPDSGYDKYFWESWTKDIMINGLGSIYLNPGADNHPLNMHLLKLMSWFFSDPASVTATSVNWLKAIVLPFNLLSILLSVFLLKQNGFATSGVGWLILNPAFWYNTVIWGQLDVVFTFYAFLALILAERKYWKLAWLSFLVALNFKLQAIVIAPLLLILTYHSIKYDTWKGKFTGLLGLLLVQVTILSPFIFAGHLPETLSAVSGRSIGRYPVIARQAYNVWHFFFADPFNTPDSVKILQIPMKFWGLILFGLASAMNLSLLALAVANRAFENLLRWERLSVIFQVAALVYLAFFLFNTQMHERYVHPAILFSVVPFLIAKDRVVYLLVSFAYLLNMEAVMQMFGYYDQAILGFDVDYSRLLIFNPMFIAGIFLFSYIWGTVVHARQFLALKNSITETIVTT